MLAQTNLQLYAQLTALGWSSQQLASARTAYDVARELFGACFRPTHKPFVCHLVGTASAAAQWGARPAVVLAGLLHSAYLYGQFDDGERGASPRRRLHLQRLVGGETEGIVFGYTALGQGVDEALNADVEWVRLADLLDELLDAGPRFAPEKGVSGRLGEEAARRAVVEKAGRVVGPVAVRSFFAAFDAYDAATVDPVLSTRDTSYHRLPQGCAELRRSALQRRVIRMTQKFRKDAAA